MDLAKKSPKKRPESARDSHAGIMGRCVRSRGRPPLLRADLGNLNPMTPSHPLGRATPGGSPGRGLVGYAPLTGATPPWSTRKESGPLSVAGIEPAPRLRMFRAPLRSLCSLCPSGQVTTPLGPLATFASWIAQ